MSSLIIPNINALGTPGTSVPPSPGSAPAVLNPADADFNNVATMFAGQLTDLVGYLDYIQSSARLAPPQLSATAGYSPPVYSTAPAFGGTVAVSGNGSPAANPAFSSFMNSGVLIIVNIVAGGPTGTATYRTSVTGGVTWGSTQATGASVTDAATGLTLAFGGTFTANGVALVRPAFTPLLALCDAAGNVRAFYDSNGFRTGRVVEMVENFEGLGTTSFSTLTPGSGVILTTKLNYTVSVAGTTITLLTPSYASARGIVSSLLSLNLPTTTAAQSLIASNGLLPVASGAMVASYEWTQQITKSGVNQTFTAGPNPGGGHFAQLRCNSADATYFLDINNGTGTTSFNTGVAFVSGTYIRVKMVLFGAASPLGVYFGGAPTMALFINEQLVAGPVLSGAIPTDTAGGLFLVTATNTGTASGGSSMAFGGFRCNFAQWPTIGAAV